MRLLEGEEQGWHWEDAYNLANSTEVVDGVERPSLMMLLQPQLDRSCPCTWGWYSLLLAGGKGRWQRPNLPDEVVGLDSLPPTLDEENAQGLEEVLLHI